MHLRPLCCGTIYHSRFFCRVLERKISEIRKKKFGSTRNKNYFKGSRNVKRSFECLPPYYAHLHIRHTLSSMEKQMDDTLPSVNREQVLQILAGLMREHHSAATPNAFQQAVQHYCDELRPWVLPADVPHTPRAVFSLFDECTINEDPDGIRVRFSPEGAAFFRAWLRQRGIM